MYSTKPRKSLISFFEEHPDECFTSRDIISNKELMLSEATVYRLLSKLSEEEILKAFVSADDTGTLYRYNGTDECDSHFHLKCEKCGKLFHTECELLKGLQDHIFTDHGFSVDNSKTVFYGICKECKTENAE